MLLEAFGWRFLLKIWGFPLRFDAHFLYKIPYSKVLKNQKIIQAKGVVQQAAF